MKVLKNNKMFIIIVGVVLLVLIGAIMIKNTKNVEHRLQWWIEDLQVDEIQTKYSGEGVKIAVLDTGIDSSHPDLCEANIIELCVDGIEGIGDEAHGTAIAGIIVGYPNDANGVLGVAPLATIVSIDITDDEYATSENIIKGIELAIEEDVDVISISLGLKEHDQELHDAIIKAYEKEIIVVASAGNYMENDVLYPARYEEVICVGSISKKGEIISPKGNVEKKVVFLPGENIVTASAGEKLYIGANGTSFSCAIMAGIIALMLDANEDVVAQDVYDYFETSKGFNVTDCIKFTTKGE